VGEVEKEGEEFIYFSIKHEEKREGMLLTILELLQAFKCDFKLERICKGCGVVENDLGRSARQ